MKKSRIFLSLSIAFILFLSETVLCQDDRKQWQPPEQIMDPIGVEPGMVIGEAGAGMDILHSN